MHKSSTADDVLKKKEQKDAELDRKIEALRKKNEALVKRYQEVEEDKKRAEQEDKVLRSRKGKTEDLTVTINKSVNEMRVVTRKSGAGDVPSLKPTQDPQDVQLNPFSMGRGKRRQLLVTMGINVKGKRAASERKDLRDLTNEEEDAELTWRGKHPQVCKDRGRQEQQIATEDSSSLTQCDSVHPDAESTGRACHKDPSKVNSAEEHLEYLRWKQERDQIDRERVARHKNAKGQWKRAWDLDKPEIAYCDRFHGEVDHGSASRGGRNIRRGNARPYAESRGHPPRNRGDGGKHLQTIGSKAKGKDRLTGRARKWVSKEDEELLQAPETSLEEFLQQLDEYEEPKVENEQGGKDCTDGTAGPGYHQDKDNAKKDESCEELNETKADVVCCRSDNREDVHEPHKVMEKKVRFSTDAEFSADSVPIPPCQVEPQRMEMLKGALRHTSCPSINHVENGQTQNCAEGVQHKTPTEQKEQDKCEVAEPNPEAEHNPRDSLQADRHFLECANGSATDDTGKVIDPGISVVDNESVSSHSVSEKGFDKANENGKID